jgi:integrase
VPLVVTPRQPPATPSTAPATRAAFAGKATWPRRPSPKAELKIYLKRVRERIAKNPNSPAWGQLEARWPAVVEHAKGLVAAFRAGKAGARYVRKAADEVLKVAEAATPRDVIETVLAMSMMEELDRRRFRSDSGFRFQRVRRVRALRKLPRETPYVFTTERGGQFTADAINRQMTTIGARASLPFPVHTHMLRHGCGYALANAGHDTRAIQAWLGHANIQHTVKYTELAATRFASFWK